jgi:hypothetical protein
MSKLVITVAGNPTAVEYLVRSVVDGIPITALTQQSAVAPISKLLESRAEAGKIRMWGSVAGANDRHKSTWQRVDPGDWIAFSMAGRFRWGARIYAKLDSQDVADTVWEPDPVAGSYKYLTFFDAVTPIDVSRSAMSAALDYGTDYIYRGFIVPADGAQGHVVATYGSVEEFLGVLANERRAVAELAAHVGTAYVEDLSQFDTAGAAERLADALREHLNDELPEIVEAIIRRVKRDQRLVEKLKDLYDGRCQRCEFTFIKRSGSPYSEVAHLRRIADRLPGIDSPDNLVVLCANCHRMLDYGSLNIYWDDLNQTAMASLDGALAPLALNHHIRLAWAPAIEWSEATDSDTG